MMRIANNLREAPAVIGIAMLSIFLGAAGCAKEDNSKNEPLPVKVSWPAVAPSALHVRFVHSLGYGGARLDLNSNGTFKYSDGCCMIEQEGSGTYTIESGVVVLESDESGPSETTKETFPKATNIDWKPRRLAPIVWDQRLYLIDEDKVIEFCNQINAGFEPCRMFMYASFFLRDQDWENPASGKPNLPPNYAEYLVDEPLEAKVVSQREYKLTINKGYDDGVRLGMRMYADSNGVVCFPSGIEVVKVEDSSAAAEVRWGRWPMAGEAVYLRPKSPKD
ncbi:MAG TPA: hypothetical protein PKN33_03515 [Phycisphaerae bacterium]|nr:hypothetical protein [Phycisphaerae bacterium]